MRVPWSFWEGLGRDLKGFWEGFGRVLGGFCEDFGRILGGFGRPTWYPKSITIVQIMLYNKISKTAILRGLFAKNQGFRGSRCDKNR